MVDGQTWPASFLLVWWWWQRGRDGLWGILLLLQSGKLCSWFNQGKEIDSNKRIWTYKQLSWININIIMPIWYLPVYVEMFYLNTIEQLFLSVEQLDQLEVCLPYSRLLAGISILVAFKNLRWNSNKTSLHKF